MAKARMLHKKISVSVQVNRLILPARLLFTWMIPHADDKGRLKGDPEYIKAIVVPMVKWSFKMIKEYLEEMKNKELIYYWQENDEWFVEFMKWSEHQIIRSDRSTPSNLPSYSKKTDNQMTATCQPNNNQEATQVNVVKSNTNKVNQSEVNEIGNTGKPYKKNRVLVNPKTFKPSSEGEVAAQEAWRKLEPTNPLAFKITYLNALNKGLPPSMFYQFVSEIRQDNSIKKPGAVFNKKVTEYFKKIAQKSN